MKHMKFSPVNGQPIVPMLAEAYRKNKPTTVWEFNPWTSARRHVADIQSDPYGLAIVGDEPLQAAVNDDNCSCFPGMCRGGQVIDGKTAGGLTCKSAAQRALPDVAPCGGEWGSCGAQPPININAEFGSLNKAKCDAISASDFARVYADVAEQRRQTKIENELNNVTAEKWTAANTVTLRAAIETLNRLGYTYSGGELWEPPLGKAPAFTAPDLLNAAAGHMRDRAKTYDKPEGERSMAATVEAFNAITGRDLRESEGWLLMSILKMVRSETRDAPHRDSVEDLCAYTGLYGEARLGGA